MLNLIDTITKWKNDEQRKITRFQNTVKELIGQPNSPTHYCFNESAINAARYSVVIVEWCEYTLQGLSTMSERGQTTAIVEVDDNTVAPYVMIDSVERKGNRYLN